MTSGTRDGFGAAGEGRGPRIRKAPENFLTPNDIVDVSAGRRGFLRGS